MLVVVLASSAQALVMLSVSLYGFSPYLYRLSLTGLYLYLYSSSLYLYISIWISPLSSAT